MTAATPQPPGPAPTLLTNLPVALLAAAGYFVFFADVWGPLRPWKLAVAALVALGLASTLRLAGPRQEAREAARRRAAGHEEAARAAWPWWRRAGALASGVGLCFAGVYQSLGREVDLRAYPLVSGLCLIVSLSAGVTLCAYGLPRRRWRRRGARRPAGAARPPHATLHVHAPPDVGVSGVWGGVGTRPAARAWVPHVESGAPAGPVPARLRDLRIERGHHAPTAHPPTRREVLLFVAAALALAALLAGLLAAA